ncbi:unnamed protein product [Notodromas monacha]|uniref:Dipeptidase n=1 Tax=Notodromas monacha TaxID=399045 RepID=A0A7R9BRT5_9CRUS|nr:unnamed protein product [Notodromas monacha]CAG0920506.1 unnamed protein product [Notodromas monacha]
MRKVHVDRTGKMVGLSYFGRRVVREMNRIGMIVDLSHSSLWTMQHALEESTAPVIFSHSGAQGVCNSSRNVPDDILRLLALNEGIVMVPFYPPFVSCSSAATIRDVIRHMNHIRRVVGVDHIGIGSDFDGIDLVPSGLEDVSKYPHLLAELLAEPGWTEEDVKKVAGLNFLRVFKKVEQVSLKFSAAHKTGRTADSAHGPRRPLELHLPRGLSWTGGNWNKHFASRPSTSTSTSTSSTMTDSQAPRTRNNALAYTGVDRKTRIFREIFRSLTSAVRRRRAFPGLKQ